MWRVKSRLLLEHFALLLLEVFLLSQSLQFLLSHLFPATDPHLTHVLAGGHAELLAGPNTTIAYFGSHQCEVAEVELVTIG